MSRNTALSWIELSLLAVGASLAAWCALVFLEAWRTDRMPVPLPPLTITQTLPGESGPPPPPPAPGTWVARLEAPTVRMAATILEGTDDRTLRRGAGHIEGTPLPGQPGNIGIAGHRDTNFRPLKRIQIGDPVSLTTSERVYHFRVARTTIVDPKDVHVLDPTSEPTLTLITCYPFEFIGRAPRRFIVQAQLVTEEARTADAAATSQARR